jgi:hypothetical protein
MQSKEMQAKHKTMIVTGASQGIGAGVTKVFLERGYNVVANSRNLTESAFSPGQNLALVDGNIGHASTEENISMPSLTTSRHLWAVVLAGGDGIRLRDLTRKISGDSRPKQFCPIVGGTSLLSQTRARLALEPLFPSDRQVFVVSRAHEQYYCQELINTDDSCIIAQPLNRGTGVAIVVALAHVMQCDPDAVVGFFPCDHYYSDVTTHFAQRSDRRQLADGSIPSQLSS